MDAQSLNSQINPYAQSRKPQTHSLYEQHLYARVDNHYHIRLPEPPLDAMPEPHFSHCQCCQNTFQLREELRVFKEEVRFMWKSVHKFLVDLMKERVKKQRNLSS